MADPELLQVLNRAGLVRPESVVALAYVSPSTGCTSWVAGDLPGGTAATACTPLYAASVTKQLIGALVAQQVLAGALDRRARLADLLPGLPAWAESIEVQHLIHHTSGLPSTARVLAAAGIFAEQQLTNDAVLRGLRGVTAPDERPGQVFAYSNLGYVLLAEILAAVTSTTVADLARTSVFEPLAMSDSVLASDSEGPSDSWPPWPKDVRPPGTVGDGGWWTSASDLVGWLDALNHDRLGDEVSQLVQTPGCLDDGQPLDYAWGVTARPGARGTSYTHGGHWTGWTAKTVRRPATQTAVALLTTSNDVLAVSQAALDLHDRL